MLRTLCEVSRTPSSEDLLGEALRLLLAPEELQQRVMKANEDQGGHPLLGNDYLRAQADGGVAGDCSKYTSRCPRPFTEVCKSIHPF